MDGRRYVNWWSAWQRVTADVRAVFGLFPPMPCQILPTLAISEALLERLRFAECDALPTARLCDVHWPARATAILQLHTEDPVGNLGHSLTAAFDDQDQRVRGISWCAVIETLGNCETRTRAEEIVAREFLARLDQRGSPVPRVSQANTFCSLVSGTAALIYTEQFLGDIRDSYVEMHGGSDAAAIKSSLASAAEFLSHYDAGRRLAALRTVAAARMAASAHAATIAEMIATDPDAEVRLAAIVAYGELFHASRNSTSQRTLAELVADGNLPLRHRLAAYHGLLRVCDIRNVRTTRTSKCIGRDPDAERDELAAIDWAFVESCRRQ